MLRGCKARRCTREVEGVWTRAWFGAFLQKLARRVAMSVHEARATRALD